MPSRISRRAFVAGSAALGAGTTTDVKVEAQKENNVKMFLGHYTTEDLVTSNEPPDDYPHINIEHNLGEPWPIVELWENGLVPGNRGIYYIDNNTLRVYLLPFDGTIHVRVLA